MEGNGCVWAALRVEEGHSLLWKPSVDSGDCPGLNIPNSGSLRCLGAAPLTYTTSFPSPSPVRQYADICLFNTAQYKCPVAMEEAE